MLWIILCVATAIIYSISTFFDNYVIDVFYKSKTPQAVKTVNGRIYLIFAAILLPLFAKDIGSINNAILATFAGFIMSLAGIPYILGFKNEESTGAAVYFQMQPLIMLIADIAFLGKDFSPMQGLGFIVTLCAPLVIIFSNRRKSAREHSLFSAGMFLTHVTLASVSGAIFASIGNRASAFSVFAFWILGRGISDFLMSFTPSWRKRFKYVRRRYGLKMLVPHIFNVTICVVADFLFRFAFTITATSLASVVTNALELIFTFVLGIILTLIIPKFGREELTKRKIIAHAIAVAFAIAGIIILK